jgi:hypothetical protein
VLAADMVLVDSSAIINTLSAAGSQSKNVRQGGCGVENRKEPMGLIIKAQFLDQQWKRA